MPRKVAGVGGVVRMACGIKHSLVTRQGGEVVVFGRGEGEQWEDEEDNELDEPVIEVNSFLRLDADVGKVLERTAVPGLQVDHHQSV